MERFKARLVACENEQSYGVNYTMTFSAVMEITAAKVVLALERVWGFLLDTVMFLNAYGQADKEEGIEIPLHVTQGMELVALKLRKRLYGLKKAGRL